MNDGGLHKPISTRNENKWQSNVFGEPIQNPVTRKKLGQADNGRAGLYGDNDMGDTYQKRTTFASTISKKEETRPVKFEDKDANERKMKELYGNSGYQPQKKERQQTAPAPSGDDMNRKSRKAA